MNEDKIDPWASKVIETKKLFEGFGIEEIKPLVERLPIKHRLLRRGMISGHRDYDRIVDAIERREDFAVMSGFMPSGEAHIGNKMVMEEIIWHQQMGGEAFVAIADMEAHAVRGISFEKCRQFGIEGYITSLIALGLDPEKAHIYFQSKNFELRDLMFEAGLVSNFSTLGAIYGFSGETSVSHAISALTQSADILYPQLKEFGGPKPVVVPVGFDQDPHIRLTRDIASKFRKFRVEQRGDYISIRSKSASEKLTYKLFDKIKEYGTVKKYKGHIDVFNLEYDQNLKFVGELVRKTEVEEGFYGFHLPSSIYHRFTSGLMGGKMSSSKPESYISLTEKPEDAAKKVKRAKTGGRVTMNEQREKGGDPEKCAVFELFSFHLIEDDEEIDRIREECKEGERVCGECKALAADLIEEFLIDHQEKREEAADRIDEYLEA
ncbi:MAG: Tryptophan--tRNA ligase [Candidatus Methanolliviera sp. GoM_oil]|nr:MAG: Tryptophan--tRNA ligase [Candidatus Methanolliviera sp. GoM_oil]